MKATKQTKSPAEVGKLMKSTKDYIAEFRQQMNIGVGAIKNAAEIYVVACRRSAIAESEFTAAFPSVSKATWDTLRRIGNGDLNPMAFMLPRTSIRAIATMPIETQDKIFAENAKGFKVYDPLRKEEKVVAVADLSPSQIDILIDTDDGKVRTVEEQKAIIKVANRRAAEIVESQPNYVISGKSVSVFRNTTFGVKELKNILREMGEVV